MGELVVNKPTGYKDSRGIEIKTGDTLRFLYGIPAQEVNAVVAENNGVFSANTENNDPLSCALGELKILVGDFEIVI